VRKHIITCPLKPHTAKIDQEAMWQKRSRSEYVELTFETQILRVTSENTFLMFRVKLAVFETEELRFPKFNILLASLSSMRHARNCTHHPLAEAGKKRKYATDLSCSCFERLKALRLRPELKWIFYFLLACLLDKASAGKTLNRK
jgi:hypothetical protein